MPEQVIHGHSWKLAEASPVLHDSRAQRVGAMSLLQVFFVDGIKALQVLHGRWTGPPRAVQVLQRPFLVPTGGLQVLQQLFRDPTKALQLPHSIFLAVTNGPHEKARAIATAAKAARARPSTARCRKGSSAGYFPTQR